MPKQNLPPHPGKKFDKTGLLGKQVMGPPGLDMDGAMRARTLRRGSAGAGKFTGLPHQGL
jgi:hypothetical protein